MTLRPDSAAACNSASSPERRVSRIGQNSRQLMAPVSTTLDKPCEIGADS